MVPEIIAKIKAERYAISRPELINGTYKNYLDSGLIYMTLCEFGSRRSPIAAEAATNKNIATLFLIGGLKGIEENFGNAIFNQLTDIINQTPRVAVILRQNELKYYPKTLSRLKHTIYENEGYFIENLV